MQVLQQHNESPIRKTPVPNFQPEISSLPRARKVFRIHKIGKIEENKRHKM